MLILVLLPIAITAIVLPLWAVLTVKPGVEEMQFLAEKACMCERGLGKDAAGNSCWQAFDKLSRSGHPANSFTACFPLSEVFTCFGGEDGMCVRLGYHVVGSNAPNLCSRKEAIVAEAIWEANDIGGDTDAEQQRSFERAHVALVRFAEALARGERLEALKPAMGCVTGYPQ